MGFFDRYPYTNWHNVNLDWVLERVKEWGELVLANDQAFKDLQEANESFKDYVTSYLQNLDVYEEISEKIDNLLVTGQLQIYMQPYIASSVTDWLEKNITTPETVVIDSSLSVKGACADAAATGEQFDLLKNDLSGFVEINGADRFIKNLKVKGTITDRLITNFRNNYNGQSGFVIYKTDSTGMDSANSIKSVNDSVSGHFEEKLADGRVYSFDYDTSSLPEGQRVTAKGLAYKIKDACFDSYDNIIFGMGAFDNFGVIGDSYASGVIYTIGNDNQYHGHEYYYAAWCAIIARKYGNTCYNFSKGGLTTRSWLTDSTRGLPALRNTAALPLYICALGANDIGKLGLAYLGTIDDIHINKPSQNADTFYGNYGKILSYILEKSPKAKIIMLSVAYRYDSTERTFNNAIKDIAALFNVPFIDITFDSYYSDESVYNTARVQNHPTAVLYAGMAEANIRLIDDCIYKKLSYFADYVPIE